MNNNECIKFTMRDDETPGQYRDRVLSTFVEVELVVKPDKTIKDSFNKIRETLTRMGVPGNGKTLWQSCHILHKQGRYYIAHFKELYLLDGRTDVTELTLEDVSRRCKTAKMLSEWGLVKILKPKVFAAYDETVPVHVIKYEDKNNWTLSPKYSIGKTKKSAVDENNYGNS